MKPSPEALVNAGRALVGAYPSPSPAVIDDVVTKLCRAFDVPFTIESDAKALWLARTRPLVQRARA